MKKTITLVLAFMSLLSYHVANAQATFRIYDNEMFYGGYAALTAIPDSLPPGEGVKRLKTSLLTRKFKDTELALIGDRLSMKVLVQAACDNYDRGGHVVLAMTRKGDTAYAPTRMEIARFITPFMNKNKKPDTVPYTYELNHIAMLLKEKSIRDSFDFWCEFEIFGTPGDAWQKIAGCATPVKRSDVFYGTVELTTSGSKTAEKNNILIPLVNQFKMNSKTPGKSDTIGVPNKSFTFTLTKKSYYTRAFLITSSHGAGTNGEEYNRRNHYVFMDEAYMYGYLPGFESCEPYRKYNTQSNGIYGSTARTNEEWQSFSNWCPGAYVPTRIINLGTLEAGTHTIKLAVPEAAFANADDNIETSLFVQGKTVPYTGLSEADVEVSEAVLYPNPASEMITLITKSEISEIRVYNVVGKEMLRDVSPEINIAPFDTGMYYVEVQFSNGQRAVKTFIKK
jgi:hypothetical protein